MRPEIELCPAQWQVSFFHVMLGTHTDSAAHKASILCFPAIWERRCILGSRAFQSSVFCLLLARRGLNAWISLSASVALKDFCLSCNCLRQASRSAVFSLLLVKLRYINSSVLALFITSNTERIKGIHDFIKAALVWVNSLEFGTMAAAWFAVIPWVKK